MAALVILRYLSRDLAHLISSADEDGGLIAFKTQSSQSLWRFTGSNLRASPMTFGVAGQQHLGITSGVNLITFSVD